jgi:chromosome segregation ATPase
LIDQVKEAEVLGTRVNDLETQLATQGKLLADREHENGQLKQASELAGRTIKELRTELAALSAGDHSPAIEKLRSEKAAVDEQLRIVSDERAKLQRDVNAIQQQAESSWTTERMENALLRERINDIAAEVAKLAIQLEGPNSAIEAMLSAEPTIPAKPAPKAGNGAANGTPAGGALPEGGGTLADRIRALQSHASRARQQGA